MPAHSIEDGSSNFDTNGIVGHSAAWLAQRLRDRELSAREVVDAHVARIEEVDADLNAVVVPRFDAARDEAYRADAALRNGAPLGPLHGIPITIKECFARTGRRRLAGWPRCKPRCFQRGR